MMYLSISVLVIISTIAIVNGTKSIPKSPRQTATDNLKASLITSSLLLGAPFARASTTKTTTFDSVEEVAEMIRRDCTKIVAASRNTGQCLYRGTEFSQTSAFSVRGGFQQEKLDTSPFDNGIFSGSSSNNGIVERKPKLENPNPDLLDSATYISPVASDYFKTLDEAILRGVGLDEKDVASGKTARVHPSIGHIATSDVGRASQWGEVISCWPLDELSYAVLKVENEWWNDEWTTVQGKRGPLFWRNPEALTKLISNEILFDSGLEGALSNGKEVLFSSTSTLGSFYSMPLYLEPKLLKLLDIKPFSNKVSVRKSSGVMRIE